MAGHSASRRARGLWRTHAADEDHRATTLELLFDVVYVFALTQVTGYMAHEHTGQGVLLGILILALLWVTCEVGSDANPRSLTGTRHVARDRMRGSTGCAAPSRRGLLASAAGDPAVPE